jgi:hypothetical protein
MGRGFTVMPAGSDDGGGLPPAQLCAVLEALVHGPYGDADTAGVAGLAAESVRYLNYAVPRGGVSDPATVAAVAAELSTAAYRLPQLLAALGGWLTAEADAGRVADDHRRPPAELAAKVRAAFGEADDYAAGLARALSAAHNLAATLHAAGTAAPAA